MVIKPSFGGIVLGIVVFGLAAMYYSLNGGYIAFVLGVLGLAIVAFEVFLRERLERFDE